MELRTQITVDEDLDETMAHLLDILLTHSNWDLGTLGNLRIIKIKLLVPVCLTCSFKSEPASGGRFNTSPAIYVKNL